MCRIMCVGADRDELAAELPISPQDVGTWIGLSEAGAETVGVELDSLFILDQVRQ